MTVKNVGAVKIGQIYKDNDPRSKGRRKVEVVALKGASVQVRNIVTGHETKIMKKRLLDTTLKGYSFLGSKRGRKPRLVELESVTLKVSQKIHRAILANAKMFAEGNISAWLRHTGSFYKMKKGEKVNLEAL